MVIGGRNKYMINGTVAQQSRVQNLFHSVQLNVNNPHFLVRVPSSTLPPSLPRSVLTARRLAVQIMQGRITKVLNMKPQEILGLIEEAAGTRMFELKKQQAVKTIEKKQTKLGEIDRVFEEDLTPRLEKLGSERAEYLEYKKSEQDVETLSRVCQAHDYFSSEKAQQKCTEATEEGKARQAELAAAVEQAEQDKVAKKEQKARALSKKTEDGAGEMKTLESEESEVSKQLVKLGAEHGQLESTAEADSATAKGLEQTIADTEKAQTKARAELKKAEAASAKAQAVHSERAQALQTKREQYEAQMGIATASGDGAKDMQGQLSEAEANLSTSVTAQKTADMRLKHLVKEVKDAEKKFKDVSKSGKSEQTDGAALQKDVASLRTKMGRLDYDETQEVALGTDQHKQQSEHARLCKEAEAVSASVGGLEFRYNPPSRDFDRRRVKGTIASNLRVKDPAHATALEALAGGRLHHVVVDDEQTGMLLLTEGGLQRRVTLIPLSKIQCAPPPPTHPPQSTQHHTRVRVHTAHTLRARSHTHAHSAYPGTWVRRALHCTGSAAASQTACHLRQRGERSEEAGRGEQGAPGDVALRLRERLAAGHEPRLRRHTRVLRQGGCAGSLREDQAAHGDPGGRPLRPEGHADRRLSGQVRRVHSVPAWAAG